MRKELARQAVHLSGIAFVIASPYLGRLLSASIFLCIGVYFLGYSIYLRRRPGLSGIEDLFRRLVFWFERKEGLPLAGPMWFYLGLALTYALFPIYPAFLGGMVLSVGDSLATAVGKPCGRHCILPGKSLEGFAAFLASSFLACLLFAPPHVALAASAAGLAGEALPALPGIRERGVNDNLSIPLLAALAALLALSG